MDRARLAEMLDAARLYCAEQRWGYRDVEERIIGRVERLVASYADSDERDGNESALLSRDTIETEWPLIDDSLQGILIMPHPESEPLWLTFNAAGELVYYVPLDDVGTYWERKALATKMDAAGMETHIAVCDFFHYLQNEFMPALNVYDEGNYFESGDTNQLGAPFDTGNAGIAQLRAALENLDGDDPRAEYMQDVLDAMEKEANRENAPHKKKGVRVEVGKKISKREPRGKRGRGLRAGKN